MSFRSRRGSFAKFLMQEEGDYAYENDNGRKYAAQDVYHFEIAWEVANKGECCKRDTFPVQTFC